MKVDRPGLSGPGGVQRADVARPNLHTPRGTELGGEQQADRLTLSDRSLQVSDLQTSLGSQPAVRAELVQRLREQIARGEYQVAPHQLADRLLRAGVIE